MVAHPMKDREFRKLDEEYKVEALIFQHWKANEIARETKIPLKTVNEIVSRIDEEMTLQAEESPEQLRAYHSWYLRRVAVEIMSHPMTRENPKLYLVGMKALADQRDMVGANAPARSMSVSMSLNTVVSAEHQQAFIDDPIIREHVLAMEQRQRELEAQGSGDVPGSIRRGRLQGTVEVYATPGPPERPDDPDRDGGDRPPDYADAPEARQELLPVAVVPGLVSGDLPRSEGDLG